MVLEYEDDKLVYNDKLVNNDKVVYNEIVIDDRRYKDNIN